MKLTRRQREILEDLVCGTSSATYSPQSSRPVWTLERMGLLAVLWRDSFTRDLRVALTSLGRTVALNRLKAMP